MEAMMVEELIIENDKYRLFKIPLEKPSEEWINFRVRTCRKRGETIKRSRLAYSRLQKRMAFGKSAKAFMEKDIDAFNEVVDLIRKAIDEGLV